MPTRASDDRAGTPELRRLRHHGRDLFGGLTPCIGPIYGSILTMAAMGGDVAVASLLLAYSLGLGIPFLATAFLLDGAASILRHLQRHLHKIELVSGAFLVAIGVLVASGQLQTLSQNFATQFADFSYNLEECVIRLNQGEIALGDLPACVNDDGSAATTRVTPDTQTIAVPSISDLAASAPETRATGLELGKVAPGFSAKTDAGASFSLADQRGKVVVLNFWATWCGPCREEMPEFEQAFIDHADEGLLVVGVNNAETAEDIAGFRDELSLTFPLLVDADASLQQLYGILAYPSTYILDRDGVIVAQQFGPMTAEQISQLVAQALA
ncbi:MAG: redoxin domain-containing protein [Anaerolineae bacterium]|nr:redoxin domain-containing protein [Anaerolineae bacterium]